MKKRIMLAISLLAVVAIIAGGTFAWFTAQADPVVNEFKAGTMGLNTYEVFYPPTNVNPGDNFVKLAWFHSTGTKRAYVRAKLTPEFINLPNAPEGFEPDMSIVEYAAGYGWRYNPDDDYYYYKYMVDPNKFWLSHTLPLIKKVTFNGEKMNNKYQGAEFTLTIESESIQASNGAFQAVWGNQDSNSKMANLTDAELEAKIIEELGDEIKALDKK